MTELRLEIRVQAPAAEIWHLWSDFANAPQWDTDVRHCTLDGPFAAGTRGLCTLKNGLKMPLRLEDVKPTYSYTNSARLLGMDLNFSHHLRRIGARETHVIHTVRLAGRFSFLYRGLMLGLLRGAMSKALRNLRTLAEQRATLAQQPPLPSLPPAPLALTPSQAN
ncbi:SRPBCC family protein [Pseudomonas sp. TE3610]